jgi:hypothetical protein
LQPGFAPPHYQLGKLLVRANQPAPCRARVGGLYSGRPCVGAGLLPAQPRLYSSGRK